MDTASEELRDVAIEYAVYAVSIESFIVIFVISPAYIGVMWSNCVNYWCINYMGDHLSESWLQLPFASTQRGS